MSIPRLKLRPISLIVASLMTVAGLVAVAPAAQAVPEAATSNRGSTSGGTSVTIADIHFVQVSTFGSNSLGLTNQGTVYAWGSTYGGSLGDGTFNDSPVPVQVRNVNGAGYLTNIASVAAGFDWGMALTRTGLVYAWGNNEYGQLGNITTTRSSLPVAVTTSTGVGALSGIASIAAGSRHSIAVTERGNVYAWGDGTNGQLGDGPQGSAAMPVKVLDSTGTAPLANIASVAAGGYHCLALTRDGTVFSWGYGGLGQLGDGHNSDTRMATAVLNSQGNGPLTDIVSLGAGLNHSLAVTKLGNVVAWGYNYSGQLGDGTTTTRNLPVTTLNADGTAPLSKITAVAGGRDHTVATSSTNTVFAWGSNDQGQLGDGSTTDHVLPAPVSNSAGTGPLTDIVSLSSSEDKALAVTSSNELIGWGDNADGQLGDGSIIDSSYPVLSANFHPTSVKFAENTGVDLSPSGGWLTVTTPGAAAPGDVTITAQASLFAGTTEVVAAATSWNAGTFTYLAPQLNAVSTNDSHCTVRLTGSIPTTVTAASMSVSATAESGAQATYTLSNSTVSNSLFALNLAVGSNASINPSIQSTSNATGAFHCDDVLSFRLTYTDAVSNEIYHSNTVTNVHATASCDPGILIVGDQLCSVAAPPVVSAFALEDSQCTISATASFPAVADVSSIEVAVANMTGATMRLTGINLPAENSGMLSIRIRPQSITSNGSGSTLTTPHTVIRCGEQVHVTVRYQSHGLPAASTTTSTIVAPVPSCSVGTYQSWPSSVGTPSCVLAPRDSYSSTVNASAARACPRGKYTLASGSTSANDCVAPTLATRTSFITVPSVKKVRSVFYVPTQTDQNAAIAVTVSGNCTPGAVVTQRLKPKGSNVAQSRSLLTVTTTARAGTCRVTSVAQRVGVTLARTWVQSVRVSVTGR